VLRHRFFKASQELPNNDGSLNVCGTEFTLRPAHRSPPAVLRRGYIGRAEFRGETWLKDLLTSPQTIERPLQDLQI
jgi:hypothetical protein